MKKLVEVIRDSITVQSYSLREIFVNPAFVVSLMPDEYTIKLLNEGKLPKDMDPRQEFTKVTIHKGSTGQEMVVVGAVDSIRIKLYTNPKQILRG